MRAKPSQYRNYVVRLRLTSEIEIVANANGSPMIWPKANRPPRRPSIILCFSCNGELKDPYEGI